MVPILVGCAPELELFVVDVPVDLLDAIWLKRSLSGQKLIHDHAETPHINFLIVGLSIY